MTIPGRLNSSSVCSLWNLIALRVWSPWERTPFHVFSLGTMDSIHGVRTRLTGGFSRSCLWPTAGRRSEFKTTHWATDLWPSLRPPQALNGAYVKIDTQFQMQAITSNALVIASYAYNFKPLAQWSSLIADRMAPNTSCVHHHCSSNRYRMPLRTQNTMSWGLQPRKRVLIKGHCIVCKSGAFRILVSFLVAIIKFLNKKQLRGERVYFSV